jgi:recombinational DNA repair ATPase RecF
MSNKITRVRVNGGFLAGLDLQFSAGLNVIIGPRGSGKTALIELVRHALTASQSTQATAREREKSSGQYWGTVKSSSIYLMIPPQSR